MKTTILACAIFAAFAAPARAAKLKVLATIPDLADMTRRVGGDHVDVEGSLARGTEDIHQVVMKPSFVSKLNRADAVVYLGLTVEHSFLPGLLDAAVNPKMRTDPVRECVGPGCIDCSAGIRILEKPSTLSRAEGELHPYGNPHYNLGPQNAPLIARNIEVGLARLDPAHAADYEKNLKAYVAELDARIAAWKKMVAPLKGMKAVSYHKDVAYLAAFTGLDFIETVELKPGVPPTPSHMQQLVEEMKSRRCALIVREQHFEPQMPHWLADQTGAKIAVIGQMANSLPNTDTWEKFIETILKNLLAAAGKP